MFCSLPKRAENRIHWQRMSSAVLGINTKARWAPKTEAMGQMGNAYHRLNKMQHETLAWILPPSTKRTLGNQMIIYTVWHWGCWKFPEWLFLWLNSKLWKNVHHYPLEKILSPRDIHRTLLEHWVPGLCSKLMLDAVEHCWMLLTTMVLCWSIFKSSVSSL